MYLILVNYVSKIQSSCNKKKFKLNLFHQKKSYGHATIAIL